MYCILRTAKLKTAGNIIGSGRHNWRESQTDNADSTRTPLNRTQGAQSSAELLTAIQARLNTVSHVRKNGVLAIEYFIGASPEFFKLNKNNSRNYFDGAIKWLIDKHGAENVVAITEQYDETSPHLVAYVVPIDERGKLNAAGYLGGRKKLSEMQTDFAIQCGEPFGLMRGIQGSKAKHIECSKYYSAVNSKTPEVITTIPDDRPATFSENIMSAAGIDNDYTQLQKRRKKAIAEREAEEKERQIALENKAKQFEFERDNNRKRDFALSELRDNYANYAQHLADLKANSDQALADLKANSDQALADLKANSALLREIAEREAEEKERQIALENKAKQFEFERDNNRKRDFALSELRDNYANYAQHLADLKANSDQALADLKANSALLREIPLRDVLLHLGCRPNPNDPNSWITRAGRLSVEGRKFYLHDVGAGGGGAIDLVKAVEDTDYQGALKILSQGFGVDATVSHELARSKARVEQIVAAPAPFVPPPPSPQNWPAVRSYLTDTRKLAGDLIDELHREGGVYADKFANAVFVLGGGRGVSLQSTADAFHCVRGETTAVFAVADGTEKEVAFTESCIDALSLRQLGFKGEILATPGQSADSVRAKADLFRRGGFQIVAAFDDNKMMADAIKADRQLEPQAKDWNADLLQETAAYELAHSIWLRELHGRAQPPDQQNALEAAIAPQQPQPFRSPPRPGQ